MPLSTAPGMLTAVSHRNYLQGITCYQSSAIQVVRESVLLAEAAQGVVVCYQTDRYAEGSLILTLHLKQEGL